jgi:hypothetical protein
MTSDNIFDDQPTKKKKGCLFWILIALGIITILGVIGTIFGPTDEEKAQIAVEREAEQAAEAERQEQEAQERRDSAVKVTAAQLAAAYENNEAAAQQKFGGKLVEVTGVIDGVELDISDDPVVKLATSNQFLSASVYLTEETQGQAASYSKGEQRTFLCEDVSEVISIPQLKECVPVE